MVELIILLLFIRYVASEFNTGALAIKTLEHGRDLTRSWYNPFAEHDSTSPNQAVVHKVLVEEGDCLLLPGLWWHATEALSRAITLTTHLNDCPACGLSANQRGDPNTMHGYLQFLLNGD